MKKKPLKSPSLLELELAGAKFVKPTKDGEYVAKKSKKQGATHKIETTSTSTLAVPLKKWKHKSVNAGYGEPKVADEQPADDHSWHPPIPAGATWIEYSTSTAAIMMPISELHSLRGFRGKIRFGKLRYEEDFISLMPGEVGNITRWKDGVTIFAEGNSPAELKAKAKAAAERVERQNNPPEHVKEAFAKQAAARRAAPGPRPGDIPGKIQCGVKKPTEGKTAEVWAACDALLKELGRCPSKAEAVAKLPAVNPGTVGTQHSAWRRFYGHQTAA